MMFYVFAFYGRFTDGLRFFLSTTARVHIWAGRREMSKKQLNNIVTTLNSQERQHGGGRKRILVAEKGAYVSDALARTQ